MRPAASKPPAPPPEPSRERHGLSFWIGVALMLSSFAVYPSYVLIAFLPLSMHQITVAAIVAAVASWVVFLGGTTLAGPGGWRWVKAAFARWRERARAAQSLHAEDPD